MSLAGPFLPRAEKKEGGTRVRRSVIRGTMSRAENKAYTHKKILIHKKNLESLKKKHKSNDYYKKGVDDDSNLVPRADG